MDKGSGWQISNVWQCAERQIDRWDGLAGQRGGGDMFNGWLVLECVPLCAVDGQEPSGRVYISPRSALFGQMKNVGTDET